MSVIIKLTTNKKSHYAFIDEAGRIIATFPDHDEGLRDAIAAAFAKPRRGKVFFPVPSNLPDGYAVIGVIDGEQIYYIVAIPGGFLPGTFETVVDALDAAARAVPDDTPTISQAPK